VYNQIDIDNSGLQFHEVSRAFRKLGYKVSKQEIDDICWEVDEVGNGCIQFDAILYLLHRLQKAPSRCVGTGSNLFRGLLEYMMFDTDGSGGIDMEEVQQMLHVYYGFRGSVLERKMKAFAQLRTKRTETIKFGEFQYVMDTLGFQPVTTITPGLDKVIKAPPKRPPRAKDCRHKARPPTAPNPANPTGSTSRRPSKVAVSSPPLLDVSCDPDLETLADMGVLSGMLHNASDPSLVEAGSRLYGANRKGTLVALASDDTRTACWKSLRDPVDEFVGPASPLAVMSERRFKTFGPIVLRKLDDEALSHDRTIERKTAAMTARPKMVLQSALIKPKEPGSGPRSPRRRRKKRAKSPAGRGLDRELSLPLVQDPFMMSVDSCLEGLGLPESPRKLRRKRWRKKISSSDDSNVFLLSQGFDAMTDEEIIGEYWKIVHRKEKEEATEARAVARQQKQQQPPRKIPALLQAMYSS